jgi:hypothetical protein
MSLVSFFSYTKPSAEGHGGQHRSYQILHELKQLPQVSEVQVQVFEEHYRCVEGATNGFVMKFLADTHLRVGNFLDNPLRLLARSRYTKRLRFGWQIFDQYEQSLKRGLRPHLSVLEGSMFSGILNVNRRYGIPTLICPQTMESLHTRITSKNKLQARVTAWDFGTELKVLANATERLFISRVETSLAQGLGYPSHYYPYVPVGKIADEMRSIRTARTATQPERGLFLILGSLYNDLSREGLNWFLNRLGQNGIPDGLEFHVIGRNTDEHPKLFPEPVGVKFLGYVAQEKLNEYLQRATGVLVLSNSGFGALTRFSEMAYAGIPVITFAHPTYSIAPYKNIFVAYDWSDFITIMRELTHSDFNPQSVLANELDNQGSVLQRLASKILETAPNK